MHKYCTNYRLSPDKFVFGAVKLPIAVNDSQSETGKKNKNKKNPAHLEKFHFFPPSVHLRVCCLKIEDAELVKLQTSRGAAGNRRVYTDNNPKKKKML